MCAPVVVGTIGTAIIAKATLMSVLIGIVLVGAVLGANFSDSIKNPFKKLAR